MFRAPYYHQLCASISLRNASHFVHLRITSLESSDGATPSSRYPHAWSSVIMKPKTGSCF